MPFISPLPGLGEVVGGSGGVVGQEEVKTLGGFGRLKKIGWFEKGEGQDVHGRGGVDGGGVSERR